MIIEEENQRSQNCEKDFSLILLDIKVIIIVDYLLFNLWENALRIQKDMKRNFDWGVNLWHDKSNFDNSQSSTSTSDDFISQMIPQTPN
jgi:hypothetical protein